MICTRRQFAAAWALSKPGTFELIEITNDSRWPHADSEILPGSLVKPFTALAYGAANGQRFPKVRCEGCRPGTVHGDLDLIEAIAVSCNRYFEVLSLQTRHEQACLVASEYGMPTPPDTVDARIGLGRQWRMQPAALLRAYSGLAANHAHPAVKLILEGMKQCALRGTAKAMESRGDVLAKTGTAPCEHKHAMPGDGLAIALWPADAPRRIVLVREHGVPGAQASKRLRGYFG